ncbi:MAG: lysozyme [Pseudomonadota bacterium]
MRHITDDGLNLIKTFEGFVPHLYICAGGYPTIGYGHVILQTDIYDGITGAELLGILHKHGVEAAKEAYSMSREEAEEILRRDVHRFERTVLRLINVPLEDGQFDALVSFTYNLGGGALQRSTLRKKVNRGHHGLVPREFRKWVWAGGRKLRGLMRRREAEAELYMYG